MALLVSPSDFGQTEWDLLAKARVRSPMAQDRYAERQLARAERAKEAHYTANTRRQKQRTYRRLTDADYKTLSGDPKLKHLLRGGANPPLVKAPLNLKVVSPFKKATSAIVRGTNVGRLPRGWTQKDATGWGKEVSRLSRDKTSEFGGAMKSPDRMREAFALTRQYAAANHRDARNLLRAGIKPGDARNTPDQNAKMGMYLRAKLKKAVRAVIPHDMGGNWGKVKRVGGTDVGRVPQTWNQGKNRDMFPSGMVEWTRGQKNSPMVRGAFTSKDKIKEAFTRYRKFHAQDLRRARNILRNEKASGMPPSSRGAYDNHIVNAYETAKYNLRQNRVKKAMGGTMFSPKKMRAIKEKKDPRIVTFIQRRKEGKARTKTRETNRKQKYMLR